MNAVADGFRLGMVVEVRAKEPQEGEEDISGMLGQIVSASAFEASRTFTVCLLNGATVELPEERLEAPQNLKRPGCGGDAGSFDVLIGPKPPEDVLGEEVSNCLFEKGFCVMRLCESPAEQNQAVEAARAMGERGRLHRLPEEVEEGYLGLGNRGKVAWLDGFDAYPDSFLRKSDDFFSTVATSVQPFCADVLGKSISERSPALLSLSLTDEEEALFAQDDADDATLGKFLRLWRRSALKIVRFVGPAAPMVQLALSDSEEVSKLPVKLDKVSIEGLPGTIVIFRTALFSYSCPAEKEFLTLTATFLEQTGMLVVDRVDGDTGLLMAGDGPPGPYGDNVEVVNLSSRLMAVWDEPEAYRAGLYGGGDAGVEIPRTRWDVWDYFNEDLNTLLPWQSCTRHQSLVEGIELFDHKYFEVIASEARVMDPMQRHVLEVGAQNLFKLGITKKVSNRNPHHAGCSIGLDKDDWDRIPDKCCGDGGNNVQAIISNRFSFIFNLRGPNFVADTACSAALCATHLAKFTLQDRNIDKLEFHVALGIHQCLSPIPFVGCSQSHMCSNIGRCLTFNASASGYMRGDGCSGMALKYGTFTSDREAVWRASQCGQNGRAATLTAPNGLSQEDVIMKCFAEGKFSPPESCIWNCHGTGTSLGDPIEVNAVRKIQIRQKRTTALIVVTNKPHTGHLEGGAAMTTLICACLQVKASTATPVLHLGQLNPHLEASQFDAFFGGEPTCYRYLQGNVHVSSFGFGGTNGHVVFWGHNQYGCPDVTSLVMRKLKRMGSPEVRVSGADPDAWEWDGPDKDIPEGGRYSIAFSSDDPVDMPAKWVKEPLEVTEEEDDFYCITGPFNEWDVDRMEDGAVTGLRIITLHVPQSGALRFCFLKNGEEEKAVYPVQDNCTRKLAPIIGPGSKTKPPLGLGGGQAASEKNTWLVEGAPSSEVRIELFALGGLYSVNWLAA